MPRAQFPAVTSKRKAWNKRRIWRDLKSARTRSQNPPRHRWNLVRDPVQPSDHTLDNFEIFNMYSERRGWLLLITQLPVTFSSSDKIFQPFS
jgi:hypothetical protein